MKKLSYVLIAIFCLVVNIKAVQGKDIAFKEISDALKKQVDIIPCYSYTYDSSDSQINIFFQRQESGDCPSKNSEKMFNINYTYQNGIISFDSWFDENVYEIPKESIVIAQTEKNLYKKLQRIIYDLSEKVFGYENFSADEGHYTTKSGFENYRSVSYEDEEGLDQEYLQINCFDLRISGKWAEALNVTDNSVEYKYNPFPHHRQSQKIVNIYVYESSTKQIYKVIDYQNYVNNNHKIPGLKSNTEYVIVPVSVSYGTPSGYTDLDSLNLWVDRSYPNTTVKTLKEGQIVTNGEEIKPINPDTTPKPGPEVSGIENPKTGIAVPLISLGILGVIAVIIFVLYKKKKVFKDI